MPATTSLRAATGRLTTSPAPFWFTVTTGRVGRLATIITLLLTAALLAGCTVTVGARDTVDPARVSASLTRWLEDQSPDVRVGSIACPSGVKLTKGRTFECTADMEGAQLPVTVTLTHVDTDKGEYDVSFEPAKALINTDKAAEALRSNLPDKVNLELAGATVDCGTPRVRVVEVGGSIDCTVSKGDTRHVVRAVIEDVAGTAHFELADPPPPRPEVATGKVGDKLTVYDEFGEAQLEVTITQVKFSRGDEFAPPQRGLFMGAHVKAHALADDQYPYNLYARVRGRLYDQAVAGFAFEPLLEPVPLNRGERASGWALFDVPTRHGQLVLRDLDDKTVGLWKY
jgi:Domain of unknown function (DUF4333)